MKYIVALMFLLTSSAFAASGSSAISNTVSFGGVNTVDNLSILEPNTQGYFTIWAGSNTYTAGNFSYFLKDGTPYQVTAGKTLKVVKICMESATASESCQLVSSTASIAFNTSTALTGGIFQGGAAGQYVMEADTTAHAFRCFSETYSIPASAFVGYQCGTSTFHQFMIVGKEI